MTFENIGGELLERRGCFSPADRSVHSVASDLTVLSIALFKFTVMNHHKLLNLSVTWCFYKGFISFLVVLLAARGCICVLRGYSRTLKTPISPPLFENSWVRP